MVAARGECEPSTKTSARGVFQCAATVRESPTIPTTVASSPAAATVRRQWGNVSTSPRVRVHHALVVELLARLVLLGAAMVIKRKERGVCLARGRPQVDRRLAAVGADLEQRSKGGDAHGRLVESQAFVLGMKPTAAAAARLRGSSIGLLSQIRRRGERLCHTAAHVGPERAQGVVLLRLGQLRL